ncbi:MAG: NIF family HAD-type phosphatase [Chloroflexota bacterium]
MEKPRIAFDLDETLGIPKLDSDRIIGFHIRTGARPLLDDLAPHYTLCLWSVSTRSYVDKVLSFRLGSYFAETYSWDEQPVEWKDVRRLDFAYLIDDSSYHREMAVQHGIGEWYIIVPMMGSPEDEQDSLAWCKQVRQALLQGR